MVSLAACSLMLLHLHLLLLNLSRSVFQVACCSGGHLRIMTVRQLLVIHGVVLGQLGVAIRIGHIVAQELVAGTSLFAAWSFGVTVLLRMLLLLSVGASELLLLLLLGHAVDALRRGWVSTAQVHELGARLLWIGTHVSLEQLVGRKGSQGLAGGYGAESKRLLTWREGLLGSLHAALATGVGCVSEEALLSCDDATAGGVVLLLINTCSDVSGALAALVRQLSDAAGDRGVVIVSSDRA